MGVESEMKFKWGFCPDCNVTFVFCPKCGNNCCNGGYGEVEGEPCDVCPLAYQYQTLAYDNKLNPLPGDSELVEPKKKSKLLRDIFMEEANEGQETHL